MATEVWGNLPKSQIDNELIEEAIARLIQAHEDDANSHLEVGESLYSHKVAEIIDHAVQSVVTDKLKDLGVTTGKLDNLAVTEAKIGNLAVTTAKIQDLNVTEAKIGALQVTEGKIGNLAVTTAKIGSLAVTELKIGSLAVTEAKLGSLAVTVGKIGNQAVETGKIKDLAVTNAKIGNLAVTEAKIDSLAVTNAKIANLAVDDAKISNLTVEKLTGTYLTGKTVRTASSGKRVEMRGANNDLVFYDSGGVLGGTILGQSGKIYISGGGLTVECSLSMEDEFIPDTIRDMIPSINNTYDVGTSSYKWRNVYIAGDLTLPVNTPNLTGDIVPTTNDYYELGLSSVQKWYKIWAHYTGFGDVGFANEFRITEEGDKALAVYNQIDKKIMVLDEKGNLWLAGKLTENIIMKTKFPFYKKVYTKEELQKKI